LPVAALLAGGRRSVRLDGDDLPRHGSAGVAVAAGFTSLAIGALRMGGVLWGTVGVAGRQRLADDVPARLEEFAQLATTTIAHAEARARLAAQATTDYLTGLLNHRSFHERLHAEWERARRHDRPLALVLFDIDRFKAVNDTAGHHAGDRVLEGVAERLRTLARPGDVLGRIGGDEIAWLLPETDGLGAFAAAERARAHVAAAPIAHRVVTLSAGACDRVDADDAEALLRLADGALYWAKAHGRDAAYLYDPEVVRELSADERAQRLAREQALVGLRALARAVDAKDPSTQRHAERVAATAVALATVLGWPEERRGALHEAGLLHDVGKIGVPDAVLFKPGRLTPEEYAQVKQHAELGAEIANEVLAPEQVAWIRQHHERWDGGGYPAGLAQESISEGGRILALADAWDVMTGVRPYQVGRSVDDALRECRACGGTQFDPRLVEVLIDCVQRGTLPIAPPAGDDDRTGVVAASTRPM
ncbi:MAG TPA: diguanylate cyclase, partial [Egibacteraceae bacterium]|nr:diguanylate cyclase [Egibacteraceae bacterium]